MRNKTQKDVFVGMSVARNFKDDIANRISKYLDDADDEKRRLKEEIEYIHEVASETCGEKLNTCKRCSKYISIQIETYHTLTTDDYKDLPLKTRQKAEKAEKRREIACFNATVCGERYCNNCVVMHQIQLVE